LTTKPPTASSGKYRDAVASVDSAADDQLKWNRPNTANPWAQQQSNPDGSVSLGFTGPLKGAQGNLMAQALRGMSSPTDFGEFNIGTGDDFRNQAIGSAQGQMNDWLAPLQGGQNDAERQRLLAMGFDEGSPEFAAQMGKGDGAAADMQSTIGNAAIGLGAEHGAKMQGMELLSKQQGLAEALRQRSLPMEQLSAMSGLLEQPGYEADGSMMQGATMGLQEKLGDFWGQRSKNEQDRAAIDSAFMDGFGALNSAASFGAGFIKPKGAPTSLGKGPVQSI
jgi:hypothetical protein